MTLARRKQGGSQSVNDNAKGAAVSAGAMLRRYGEQALRDVSLSITLTSSLTMDYDRTFATCWQIGQRILMNVNVFGYVRVYPTGGYS